MFDLPSTFAEAKAHRYNQWAGNPKGNAYVEGRCAFEVASGGRATLFYECIRKAVCGPDNLYCKQHDPAAQAARHKTSAEKYRRQQRRDDIARDLYAVNRTADLLRAASKIGPSEACKALAKRLRAELAELDRGEKENK